MKALHKLTALLMTAAMASTAMPVFAAENETADPVLANVTLNGNSVSIDTLSDAAGISADGTKITVTASGAYWFSGTLTDGQIIVNIPDEVADPGTVKLFLNGVDITGVSEAPIYIVNAENTSINLVDGTENVLRDGGKFTETTAVIYAKDDITIKGSVGDTAGKLTVNSVYQDGIQCNNDIKLTGGNVKVRTNDGDGTTTGIGDGIRGKTSVTIKDGKLDVNAGGDGVKSTKGTVTISGGDTEIKASNDAVQGETALDISGGRLKANGDRGLRLDNGTINITGGDILASATDYQVNEAANNTIINASQVTVLISLTEEQVKDQEVSVTDRENGTPIISFTPDKKFSYLLLSSDKWDYEGHYKMTIAGKELTGSEEAGTTITENGLVIEFLNAFLKEPEAAVYNVDIDCDGEEELEDLVLLAKIIGEDDGIANYVTADMTAAADVNADGVLDLLDLRLAMQIFAGQDVSA